MDSSPQSDSSPAAASLPKASGEAQVATQPGREMGGGLPIIQYWAEHTLAPEGPKVWQTLFHKSACLSCAWGTGGQKGGFINEEGEALQRCAKSVEAIVAEIQPGVEPHFFEQHSLAALQQLNSQECDRLGRLSFPVILRGGQSPDQAHYERIGWDEVYDLVEASFRQPIDRVASYSSGRSSNEAAYLLQLLMRALGTNNLADCSDLCHRPSTEGLKKILGTGTSTVSLADLQQTDCVVLVGSNAPANHPRLLNELIKLRDRGGQVLVVNPIREVGLVKFGSPAFPVKSLLPGSEIASLFLQPVPGSDVALFVGIQKSLVERGLIDHPFLQEHTQDWEAIVAQAEAADWSELVALCGVSQAEIEQAATMIAQSKRVIFAWAMGITHQANGVDNVYCLTNTALLTGNLGKAGAGMMPIRGHSNVQGFGSMGVKNELQGELREALEALLGRSLNREPGYDARSLIEAADQDKVDTLLCLGGNLYAANPDLTEAKRALGKIDTVVYLATKPNLGHFHGLGRQNTLILPVFNRFENPHKTTVESGNNFVRLNDAGKSHLDSKDLVAEVHFLAELAHRLLGDQPVDWRRLQEPRYVRELIAQTIPGYEKIGEIDDTQQEFTIAGRILHRPQFATRSGKAEMQPTPLPQLTLPQPEHFGVGQPERGLVVALITARAYGQHNTVVYKTADKYRGMPHRNCILMHPLDVAGAGFENHQRVIVQGEAEQLEKVEVICGDIRRGAALMFYPEANVLMKGVVDPVSRTPAFKRVPVLVYGDEE